MAVRVVEEAYKPEGSSLATVVLEASERTELFEPGVLEMARDFARSKGHKAWAVSNRPVPYPVDSQGKSSDDVLFGRAKVAAYRMDVEISAGMTGL